MLLRRALSSGVSVSRRARMAMSGAARVTMCGRGTGMVHGSAAGPGADGGVRRSVPGATGPRRLGVRSLPLGRRMLMMLVLRRLRVVRARAFMPALML